MGKVSNTDLVADSLIEHLDFFLEEAARNSRTENLSPYSLCARQVLTGVFADPIFAEHVVTHRADLFQAFLHKLRTFKGNIQVVSIVFDALMKAAFSNPESYFYSEMQHRGMRDYKPFIDDIFSNLNFFLAFEPFDQVNFSDDDIDPAKLGLFLNCFRVALDAYWKSNQYIDFERSHFADGFKVIEKVFETLAKEAQSDETNKTRYAVGKIISITQFVSWHFTRSYEDALKNNTVMEHDLEVSREKVSYDILPKSLTAGYARLIFNLLCILYQYPKDMRRMYAMDIAGDILVFEHNVSLKKIREALLEYIWRQINDTSHASNIEGYWPAILPVFLSVIGLWQDGATPDRKALYNKTVEFLNTELKPKILAQTKMKNEEDYMELVLLPPDVMFNKAKGIFEYRLFPTGTQEMIIRQ